jgi:hypothetical protein
MNYAPIALFVYNRPANTQKTVEAVLKNKEAAETDLYVFCDGPKADADTEQQQKIYDVRDYVRSITGFKSVTIFESAVNKGLAQSIIDGVTAIVNKHLRVIVLEDDLVTSIGFLSYMNTALDLYENNHNVISIHAYNYPIQTKGLPETFFIRGADCWGWATWKRGWDLFESNGALLKQQIEEQNLIYEFDINGSNPYFDMLKKQINGNINSWAIRWYASAFLKNKLTLYPAKPLVYNIGFDESGTHTVLMDDRFHEKEWQANRTIKINPLQKVAHNKLAYKRWQYFFENKKISRLKIFWESLFG